MLQQHLALPGPANYKEILDQIRGTERVRVEEEDYITNEEEYGQSKKGMFQVKKEMRQSGEWAKGELCGTAGTR